MILVTGAPGKTGRAVIAALAAAAQRAGQSDAAIATLLHMFEYYEQYGFYGNPRVLAHLIGRKPATFAEAAARYMAAFGVRRSSLGALNLCQAE